MKFVKLNINKHDLNKVSELIYETELTIFKQLLGKDEKEAIQNIKKLIKLGKNYFGHEHIYVVINEDENIKGILVSFSGRELSLWNDFKAYFKVLNFYNFLKCAVKGTLINESLTASLGKDDYYLSNVAADPQFRGQGIGTFILENALKTAEEKGCSRVLLDVTFDNKGAKRLYERFGFKVYSKKTPKLFKGHGTLNMEYFID
ncbi:MAG TPA: GNAT family N-acetyltransferase [Methanobacterium sp.]|nr:GNAT family N-acetyltransferase [Methanobacterium sp.]